MEINDYDILIVRFGMKELVERILGHEISEKQLKEIVIQAVFVERLNLEVAA